MRGCHRRRGRAVTGEDLEVRRACRRTHGCACGEGAVDGEVALDGDRAGVNAAYRLIDLALPLIETGKTIKFALMPEGYDPDDLIKERGREAMQNLVDEAISSADLLWRRETEGLSFDNPEARAALDKKLDQALSNIRDRQLKYHYQQHFKDLKWTAFIKNSGKKLDSKISS